MKAYFYLKSKNEHPFSSFAIVLSGLVAKQ